MRRKLPILFISLILLLGLGVLLYPTVSNWISKLTSSAVISDYRITVDDLGGDERQAMLLAAQEYNKTLAGTTMYDPFGGDSEELSDTYNSLLSVEGVMGYIEIPKINVYLPIYHGTSAEVLEKGVGHLENSSLPVGGENTHAVLSGHNGLPTSKLFTDLDQMVLGDIFYIHVLGETLAYQVDKISVVEPYEISELLIQSGGDYVTLLTCTPYGINTQRLLVRGTRIAMTEEGEPLPDALSMTGDEATILSAFIAVGAAVVVVLIVELVRHKRRKADWEE